MSQESIAIPLGEEGAERVVASIEDPVVKNLVRVSVAEARMRFMRSPTETEEEWVSRLPAAPFDMEFFASVLTKVFSRRQIIERLMQGESIEQASDWDV